jgi:sporulation protein YlmC with PRC-barrel domain
MTKSFLIGFSLLAFAGALHAQQQQSQRQQGQPQRQQQQMQQEQKQQRGELRVSNLKDMEAVDAQGQDIGDLGDVVIDLNSGRVHAVVLERGGVLGVGGDNFAFAPSAVKPGKQPDQVVIDIDKQKLESRQGFARNQWPGMQDEYWGRVGSASGGKQSQAAAGSGAQGKKMDQKGSQKMNLVRGSELIGKDVQDKSGKPVGKVEDVTIGLGKGEVRNLMVNLQDGGSAQVPAKAIKMSGTGDRLVIDMSAQQLQPKARETGAAGAGGTKR